jgi:hypothetical protein
VRGTRQKRPSCYAVPLSSRSVLSTNVAAVALTLVLGGADTFKERGQDNALVPPIAA